MPPPISKGNLENPTKDKESKIPKKRIGAHVPPTKRAQSLSPHCCSDTRRRPDVKIRSQSLSGPSTKSLPIPMSLPMDFRRFVRSSTGFETKKNNEEERLPSYAISKLQRSLANKKREFLKLKGSLVILQRTVLEQYAAMRELEIRCGSVPDDKIGDVKMFSVTGWPASQLQILLHDDADLKASMMADGVFGPNVLKQICSKLNPLPDQLYTLTSEILARRNDLVSWLKGKTRIDRITNLEWKNITQEFQQETERLQELVNDTIQNMNQKIRDCLELSTVPWLDRCSLLKKIEKIQRDALLCQHKIEELQKIQAENPQNHSVSSAEVKSLQEELAKEKSSREALKEVVATAESMLRIARVRVTHLERQLKDNKIELEATKKKYKELSTLQRTRETCYDVKSRKLLEASKTTEMTIEVLSRQRDALELRVKELLEQAEISEKQAAQREQELKSRIETTIVKNYSKEKHKKVVEAQVEELTKRIKDLEEENQAIRGHSQMLLDLEKKRLLEYLPTREREPSVFENETWKELQQTKLELADAQEELRKSRADKDSFLNSLTKLAQGEYGEGFNEKMALELVEREKKIFQLQRTIEKLNENEKSMEHTMGQYENELAALRLEIKKLRNYECYTEETSCGHVNMESEIVDLQIQIEALKRERAAMVDTVASHELKLERHERAAEYFAMMTRIKRELTSILEGESELENVDPSSKLELSRSLSNICANGHATWGALSLERARVINLERAMLAQKIYIERNERTRIQLESKKAQLERNILQSFCVQNNNLNRSSSLVFLFCFFYCYTLYCFIMFYNLKTF